MQLPCLYVLWCFCVLACQAHPPPNPVPSSFHPKLSYNHENVLLQAGSNMIHGRTGSAPTAPKADEDTATCPSQASQLSTRPLPSSFPAAVYQELYNAAGLSAEHDPSSSGAFTAVNLPEGWGIYPVSPMLVMRPVQVTSSVLQKFYESVIRHCAQRFWSQTSEPLLNRTIRLGMLLLMVVGDPKGQGLPWGILALLAQGMLERVRRYVGLESEFLLP